MGFASIFVPNFMVQAVVRSEPALRDHAVAIIDGSAPLLSVVAVNEAAAKAGIEIGMTKSQVQQFCGIEIRHRSLAQEKTAHATLLDLGWSVSPRIEDSAPDIVVLDLAGLNSLFGSDEIIARQLADRALSLNLIVQIIVASKIEAAIVAARGFAGITVIPEGEESRILGNLPVHVLSPSTETFETLARWGVHTCAELAALPVLQLSERLGHVGVRLHELAQGRDERSMVLAEPAVHFEEEIELEDAVEELEPLSFLLGRLLHQLCSRLAARSLAACAVRVRFELDAAFEASVENINRPSGTRLVYSDGPRNSAGLRTGLSTIAAPWLPNSYERVLSLPVPMRDSTMLLKLLRLHLQSDAPSAPVLKIKLAADFARPRVTQGGLFLPSSPDPEKLELTVARLAKLVGDSNIGSPELVDTHRPGEFRMRRFIPPRDAPETRRSVNRSAGRTNKKSVAAAETVEGSKCKACIPQIAFRIFRPALPAKVDLRDGRPMRVAFRGMRGCVVAASGPWRSSGDWWREDGWHNDEWDLEIHFLPAFESQMNVVSSSRSLEKIANPDSRRGFYRIFYDSIRQEWFVRGAYD
jgi:protein ImuB